MCLNAGDAWIFCDECWERRNEDNFELCRDCQEIAERTCNICETTFETKDQLIDNLCPKCREDQDLD